MIFNSDLIVDQNIEKIKKRAENLKFGKFQSFEDSLKFIKFWLADYYKLPSKSEIFQEYTVEELFFEFYYLSAQPEKKKEAAELVRESASEIAKMFSEEEHAAMDKIFENDVNWTLDDLDKKE